MNDHCKGQSARQRWASRARRVPPFAPSLAALLIACALPLPGCTAPTPAPGADAAGADDSRAAGASAGSPPAGSRSSGDEGPHAISLRQARAAALSPTLDPGSATGATSLHYALDCASRGTDADGWPEALDLTDADADLVPAVCDNCPAIWKPWQEDLDADGLWDRVDPDTHCPEPV